MKPLYHRLHKAVTWIWILFLLSFLIPSSSVAQATGSFKNQPGSLSLAPAGAPVLLFSDTFDRPNSTTIGNGWKEQSLKDAQAAIQSNRLCFPDTSERVMRPLVRHTFPQVNSGLLIWNFDFDWDMTTNEPAYQLLLQLGQGNRMSDNSADNGIGVNLAWTVHLGSAETLGYRRNGTFSAIQQVSGLQRFSVQANLEARTYRLYLNGLQVGGDFPFDKAVALDTVRLVTDGMDEVNFAGRCFDNLQIQKDSLPSSPPVITSTPVTQATAGQAYSYGVEATGNPAPSFSLTTSPSGMAINATSGLISWTPTASGDFPVTVAASNSAGSDSQSFTLTVNQPASPPVITSSPVTQAVVGQAYTYDVEASGSPAPAYSLTASPSGMAIDATSGLISWTPTTSGDFPVTVVASNSAGTASQSFTLTVSQPTSPPAITSTPVTQAIVGQAYVYDVNASGYPAPTFSLVTFPEGMTIDSTTGQITWTPSNAGNFDVSVLASNTAGNDTQSFTISVQPAPSLPVITSTPVIMATVGQVYLYDVEASGDPAPSFSLTASPPGMVIDSNTGLIQWTPTASGDFPVTVVATNPAGSDSQSFTLTVSQPTSPPAITSSPVMQAIVGQAYAYDVEASGSPAPTFSLSASPSGMAIDATSGLISWAPAASGDFPVTILASNSAGSDSQSFTISVLPAGEVSWVMAGANPERTSWTPEEVRGTLKPLWYRPIEPYIIPKTQVITAFGNLYISTSRGLYALNASSGAVQWVIPTELPLGHSPTVQGGIVYVGGMDHKLYAIDAQTGQGLWTFTAGKGFSTNPVVIEGKVFAGNRDGYFYAVHASGTQAGTLAWKYRTAGPILFSAAYKDGVVYFASNDSHAYALNAQNGALVWKSAKLGGAGFYSWWPVIYQDWVIFAGSHNYRFNIKPGPGTLHDLDLKEVYPNYKKDPRGTLVGPQGTEPGAWAVGTPTIDTSRATVTSNGSTVPITEYLENKPWRRTYFVLNRASGQEATFDFDGDNKPEYAPILWFGTRSGNRYPPVIGSDGVLYQANNYRSDPAIAGGHISGWKFGTPFISIINAGWNAVDEPVYYAAGGNLIYWGRCCDRVAGAVDISLPAVFPDSFNANSHRSWGYFSYDLETRIPGYSAMTYVGSSPYTPQSNVYGNRNGSYNFHGDGNPPIPYQGKVFMHRSNAVIAWAPVAGSPILLPTAPVVPAANAGISEPGTAELQAMLSAEVEKILTAGHLRPGYLNTGMFDLSAQRSCGDTLSDYWHFPGETIETLLRALPYLPPDLQTQTRAYLQSEFTAFPPYQYLHTGWNTGAAREVFNLPPEVEADRLTYTPKTIVYNFPGWSFPPQSFYAIWKYAEVFGNAKGLFDASKSKLGSVPADSVLAEMPHIHNAYIAGYWGYLELEKMAGYPESATVRAELNRLLQLRAATFTKNTADAYFATIQKQNCRSLNSSRNFIYMVPELAQYLHDHALARVQETVGEYMWVTPLWFVARTETSFGEATIHHQFDYFGLFQAKALILKEPRAELAKYLDVPGAAVGDLYYIQNLISLIEAP